MKPNILWLDAVDLQSEVVGNKAKNLGYLSRSGFSVPQGFVITTLLYERYIEPMYDDIMRLMWDAKPGRDMEDRYETTKQKILSVDISSYEWATIMAGYRQLGTLAAVRSSATLEDSQGFNFAGQHDSYSRVAEDGLLNAVKSCWASLFTPRSIIYRKKSRKTQKQSMAVLVQRFVEPYISGVTFTRDPVRDDSKLIIEYTKGHNERVVKGEIIPQMAVYGETGFEVVDHRHVDLLQRVVELCREIEKLFGCPQDVEWIAAKNRDLHVVQARPL